MRGCEDVIVIGLEDPMIDSLEHSQRLKDIHQFNISNSKEAEYLALSTLRNCKWNLESEADTQNSLSYQSTLPRSHS